MCKPMGITVTSRSKTWLDVSASMAGTTNGATFDSAPSGRTGLDHANERLTEVEPQRLAAIVSHPHIVGDLAKAAPTDCHMRARTQGVFGAGQSNTSIRPTHD